MSIRVMSQVWDSGPEKQGDLLILLALADYASDEGRCWPSIKGIAKKARMTERGVQKVLRRLEAEGWIETEVGGGRHGCSNYRINPERRSPPEQCSPPNLDAETPNLGAENPEPRSPEPSLTTIEPSETDTARNADDDKPKKARLPEGWVPDDGDVAYALSQKLTHSEIKEIADDFHAYWRDRTDAGGRKSERGWHQAWNNRVRDQAPKFIRNRNMAGGQVSGGYGRGSSIASVVARRHSQGQV